MTRLCSIDDCDRKHYARGWCDMHYKRMRDYGRLDRVNQRGGAEQPLTPDELRALRAAEGIPIDGPTEEQRRRWRLQETQEEDA